MKPTGRTARWLIAIGYRLLQLWIRTLRFEVDDRADLIGKPAREPFITAAWHNRFLLWPYVFHHFFSQYPGSALISASRDGALIADVLARYGFEVIRGSSSRQGAAALLQLRAALARGRVVGISPDGPRGPAFRLASGVIYLAQKSGAPVVPMHLEFSSCWRLNTWDRFILPRPFSTVRLTIGPPHRVAPTTDEAEFEAERVRLENAMMQLVETP